MKRITLLLFVLVSIDTLATNYYVSPTGNDDDDGVTLTTPFLTIERATYAVLPGDTVFIRNGVYTKNDPESLIAYLTVSGTENNPITFRNYPGETPILQLNNTNWGAVAINGCDYIIIDGLTIIGNNDNITLAYALEQQVNTSNPATSGNGIAINTEYNNETNRPHHTIVRNCTLSKCGGGGIYTYNADYTTIENNIVSECGWYAPYGNSGISMYQNWNSDTYTGIKNYIIGNTCYRNENYIPFYVAGTITDGNGIIIDDGRNTQNNSTLGIYTGTTYIANNLVFDNGARGIHCYQSDNVIIVNNTSYHNGQSPTTQEGELTAFDASNITYFNNIVSPSGTIPPIYAYPETTANIVSQYNLMTNNASLANPTGTNNLYGSADFVMASTNANVADFHILSASLAINAGTINQAPLQDKDGNLRLLNDYIDIGCYEYQFPLNTNDFKNTAISVFPNPVTDYLYIKNSDSKAIISITTSLGQVIYEANHAIDKIDFSSYHAGVYFLKYNKEIIKILKK